MYFYTQHTPVRLGQIITPYMYGGEEAGDGICGGTKKVAPSHVPELEIARANHRQRLLGPMSAEMQRYWKTLLKTIVPPNSEPRGRRLLCGLPLGPLQVTVPFEMLEMLLIPLPPLLKSGLSSYICLGLPSRAPALPPCAHTVRTLLLRHDDLVYQRSQFHSPVHDLSPGLNVTSV